MHFIQIMQFVGYRTNDTACQEGKKRQNASRFWKRRGYWSAAPAKAGAFRIGAAGGWRPEKALCNSSHALLHAFSASRLERLLLLGPGAYPGRRGWVGSPEGVGRDRRKSRPPPLAPAGSVQSGRGPQTLHFVSSLTKCMICMI